MENLNAVVKRVAGIIVEPIEGEAGFVVPPAGYLVMLRDICYEYGAALILDEMKTGMGHTGDVRGIGECSAWSLPKTRRVSSPIGVCCRARTRGGKVRAHH